MPIEPLVTGPGVIVLLLNELLLNALLADPEGNVLIDGAGLALVWLEDGVE